MIEPLIGDLFESQAQTLVNAVNCVGVMGKGVALEFKRRFPAMFKDYVSRCRQKDVRLGEPYLYRDESGRLIVNFPTKDHWRSPSRFEDVAAGLDYFVAHVSEWGITSVAMPALGCGHGGLAWSEVGPLLYRKLHDLPMNIEVYVPYGTREDALTAEFLAAQDRASGEIAL
jgi:O-acetyl-ADP-ribose deacetylase (regulator of RNase III)